MDKSFFNTYSEFPPIEKLSRILDKKCEIYLFLWSKRDVNNRVKITWKQVREFYNKNNFRTALRNLRFENVLSYRETESGIAVDLIA